MAFSPDGLLIAVAALLGPERGGGAIIRVFELARSGRELAALEGHGGIVYSLDWSPDGLYLLSASADGSAAVWAIPRMRMGGGGGGGGAAGGAGATPARAGTPQRAPSPSPARGVSPSAAASGAPGASGPLGTRLIAPA
jgi:hypothetical protein